MKGNTIIMVMYALVTNHCNLSCPHCNVKLPTEKFNEETFIERLRAFNGHIILFGGEPTLYQDRLMRITNDEIIKEKSMSITTNLVNLNGELIRLYHRLSGIATSWNPNRFNDNQYHTWLGNLDILKYEKINISVMVTLTSDLICIDPESFINTISKWNVSAIKFETYIGDDVTPEFLDKVDEWLCEVYKAWNNDIRNDIISKLDDWYFDCSNVYTLHPEGNVTLGCPHRSPIYMPEECYECSRSATCRPCRLQQYCSYPKKLARLVNAEKNKQLL